MATEFQERELRYPGTVTLTLGDAGENHLGMEMKGQLGEPGSGFTTDELEKAALHFYQLGRQVEFHRLTREVTDPAAILIIRNYLETPMATEMLSQLINSPWDAKYFDRRRSRVLNKRARHNVVIMDGYSQEPDYEHGKGTILDGDTIPTFHKFKQEMTDAVNLATQSDKASQLVCEGNQYYDVKRCGIGYHGDTERRKVIALRLGDSMPMCWQWFHRSKPVGDTFRYTLNHGDLYLMSEKAVGNDWRSSSKHTLRHAAGCEKYLSLKKYQKNQEKE
jgi:alkylated DNA repair dioxygenase AlkB